MKNLIILFFSFLACLSCFAQDIEKRYFENNPQLGGDVVIKSSSFKVEKDEIYKTFEVECLEAGAYYMDAWINAFFTNEGYKGYNIAVNGALTELSLKPQTDGWHSLALTDAKKSATTVNLKRGINNIAVIGKGPEVPNVEFIKLSSSLSRTGISDTNYKKFLESIKSNTLNEAYKSDSRQMSSNRGTNGEIYDYYLDVPYNYTEYFTVSVPKDRKVNITAGSSSLPCAIDFFSLTNPESYSWSASSTTGPCNLDITVPQDAVDGYYIILLRALDPLKIGETTMTYYLYGYWSSISAILTYSPQVAVAPGYSTPANFYNCDVKGHKAWLFLRDNSGKIRAVNRGGVLMSDGYCWGDISRITTNLSDISYGQVFACYLYEPDFNYKCDLYMGLESLFDSPLKQYEWDYYNNLFPKLSADNSFVSAPEGRYFCYHWSVGIDSIGPNEDIFDLYPAISANMDVWDNFYESYGYTNVGANSDNAAIALWTFVKNNKTYVNHASIRKNPNSQYPHGFAWESKLGWDVRIMHTRDALKSDVYGSITRYYRPISGTVNYSPPIASTKQKSFFSETDLNQVNALKNQIPTLVLSGFEEKYHAWEKTWSRPEIAIHSNPYRYAESTEYVYLVDYCTKYGKAVWPLLFEKLTPKNIYIVSLLRDLTYGGKWSFGDDITPVLEKGKPLPSAYSILVDYCKKLLATEETNMQNAIRSISATVEGSFEANISVTGQEILVSLNLEKEEKVSVTLYNVFGGIDFVSNYSIPKGEQMLVINASNLKKGIYIVQITIGSESVSKTISI